jgi:outer membrane protein
LLVFNNQNPHVPFDIVAKVPERMLKAFREFSARPIEIKELFRIFTLSTAPARGSILAILLFRATVAVAQTPSLTIDLREALERAQKYGLQIQVADIAAQLAKEDRAQAKAATLPTLSALNQFIYTEGNGTPSGVFVANDGVHVYNEQAVVHEELLSLVRRGELRLASAAQAVAKAKIDVAARGLKTTVVQDYYAIALSQRKLTNVQQAHEEARQFVEISHKLESGGEVARADVIKAQLQLQARDRELQDATAAVQKAKISLAVLIFSTLRTDYSVVDDLANPATLPSVPELAGQANATSPDLKAARASVTEAKLGVTVARYAYLPSFGLDFWYGIDANQFAANSAETQATGRSTLPNYQVSNRQNLGYSAAATLTVPIWNWGSIHSKVKQANLRERQADFEFQAAKRQLDADIASEYSEAQTAFSQIDSLHSSSSLSDESLRLTLLRYQAGEATALEVVDAQTTANAARNAYDDGLARYRLALSALQTLMGTL